MSIQTWQNCKINQFSEAISGNFDIFGAGDILRSRQYDTIQSAHLEFYNTTAHKTPQTTLKIRLRKFYLNQSLCLQIVINCVVDIFAHFHRLAVIAGCEISAHIRETGGVGEYNRV